MGDHNASVEAFYFGYTHVSGGNPTLTEPGYHALVHSLAPLLRTPEQRTRFVRDYIGNTSDWRDYGEDAGAYVYAGSIVDEALERGQTHTLYQLMKRGYDQVLMLQNLALENAPGLAVEALQLVQKIANRAAEEIDFSTVALYTFAMQQSKAQQDDRLSQQWSEVGSRVLEANGMLGLAMTLVHGAAEIPGGIEALQDFVQQPSKVFVATIGQ